MSELQATVEFAIELCKFYNVDLFQRGLYQVRCGLRVPPKQPVQTEVSVPETGKTLGSASVLGNGGACRPFQILYRNEEVSLQDMILFRCHMLVDSRRLRESLERAEFSLVIELWFSEQPHQSMVMVSTRTLQLNFSPSKGLHYHLPVLFDYFHLSAVSITIHATLVALHQPYIKKSILHYVQSCTPRSAKPWLGGNKFRTHQINNTSMESVFQSGTKCGGSGTNKLAQARLLHKNVCEVLLEAHQNLQVSFKELLLLLPQWQQIQNSTHRNATQRLKKLCDSAKLMDMEEDFTARANSDVAQLCAENIVQWQNFLTSVSGKAVVHQHLAKKHHALRVKRFAEAFFVVDNPRHSAAGCYDANYQNYLAISELARRSKYLVTLPPLPVHCVALDGDQTTMPIIFEDQYQDTLEFARRRSGASGKKAGSDPFLSSKIVGEPSPIATTVPQDKEDCSCGIAQILESRSASRAGVMGATQVVHAGHAVQASLNITPHNALPARHSKSLDQLRMAGHGHFATMPTRSCAHHEERKRREHNGCAEGPQQGRRRLPYASKSTVDLALRSEPTTIERAERRSLRKHYDCQNANKSALDLVLGHEMQLERTIERRSPRKHFEYHNANADLGTELPQVQRPNPERRSPKKHYEFHRTHRRNQHHQDQQAPPPPRPLSEPQHSNTSAHPKHQHCRSSDESERLRRVTADGIAQQFPRSNSTQIFPPNRQDLDVIFHHSTLILSRNKERPMTPNYRSDPERRHQYNRHRQQQHGVMQQPHEVVQQPHRVLQQHGGLHEHNLKQHDLQQNEIHQREFLQQGMLHDMSKRANCSISNRSNVDSTNTFPRYSQNSRVNKCNISKEDYNKNSSITNRYKCSTNTSREAILTSSSTDSESIPNGSSAKRLHTSASVPHHLARGPETQAIVNSDGALRHVRSASSVLEELFPLAATASESLPNLAQPDHRIVSLSTSGSTSSLTSERSGWVSSHSVSEISSPEPAPTSASGQIGPPVNGEQLRTKLYELVAGQHQKRLEQASKHKQLTTPSGYGRSNGRHDDIKLTMLDEEGKYIGDLYSYSSGGHEELRNGVKAQLEHPYIKKEIPLGVPEKDANSGYEEVRLPPPKQFRDVPLPPEPFRDPSPGPGPSPAIDNLLYHVYETIQDDIKKSKSNTDLADKIEDFLAAEEIQQQKLPTDEVQQLFMKVRNEFKGQLNFSGMLYSDLPTYASTLPYFHISDEYRIFSPEGMHLIVCVHGLDGNSADLRLVKTYLELGLPGSHLEFLMSERNQGDTFSDFDTMTDRLVGEIMYHMESCGMRPSRISFVGHSLGNIIIRSALTRPQMKPLLSRLHTFLSLSGPHLGTLYNSSGLVNMGMWFMQKWKKSGSLLQLCLRDASDVRQSFLYRLSQRSTLHHFKNVLLCGSSQDRYVPLHSARLELCKAAIRDSTALGSAYREMVHNVVSPMLARRELTLVRYDVHHALPHTANALIGRAAHIAVLDSELFIEKFLVVAGLKYFR